MICPDYGFALLGQVWCLSPDGPYWTENYYDVHRKRDVPPSFRTCYLHRESHLIIARGYTMRLTATLVLLQDSSHVRLIDDLPLEIVDLRRADFSASEGTARSM